MKILFAACSLLFLLSCNSESTQYVFDYEDVLTDEEESKIAALYEEHAATSATEIVLVTTPDWGEQEDIFAFAENFAEEHDKGENDIVFVFSQTQVEAIISTGSEIKHVFTDQKGLDIFEEHMIPAFEAENYFEGLYEGSKAIVKQVEMDTQ